jgi:surface antigen
MRRAILMLLTTLAFGGAAQMASAATRPPAFSSKPSNANYVAAVTADVRGGDIAYVTVHMTKVATCSLRFIGPEHLKTSVFHARARGGFDTWKWTVAAQTRSGRWTSSLSCRQGHKHVALKAAVNVTASAVGKVRITSHVQLKHSKTAPATSTQLVGGRGGGGYPDDDATDCSAKFGIYSWCKGGKWLSPRGFAYRNCTDFVAWFLGLTWSSFHFPTDKGNAADWKDYAANAGLSVTSSPSVGDVAWWGQEVGGGFGHVAVVTAVAGNGTVSIAEYNGDAHGNYDIRPNVRADAYLHPGSSSGPPAQTTPGAPTTTAPSGPVFGVQNTNETPPDGVYFRNSPHTADTSSITGLGVYHGEQVQLSCYASGDAVGQYADTLWYVVSNVTRPTVNGVANAGWLNAHYVNDGMAANQVDSGVPACTTGTSSPPSSGSSAPPTSTPPASTPPATNPAPAPTWSETVGGNANTWTNYGNAGGNQGPTIPGYTTVQIACKVGGFRVADGNTWWYRIASSPWNSAYYVSADAFYNNGQTGGSLHGTPFVDGNVANC